MAMSLSLDDWWPFLVSIKTAKTKTVLHKDDIHDETVSGQLKIMAMTLIIEDWWPFSISIKTARNGNRFAQG